MDNFWINLFKTRNIKSEKLKIKIILKNNSIFELQNVKKKNFKSNFLNYIVDV